MVGVKIGMLFYLFIMIFWIERSYLRLFNLIFNFIGEDIKIYMVIWFSLSYDSWEMVLGLEIVVFNRVFVLLR